VTVNLEGKRVLVTGGSSGIGLAVARELLSKCAKVTISGRRPDVLADAVRELGGPGAQVASVAADVATANGRAVTLQHALEAMGGLDVLVNNAGGVGAWRLEKISEAVSERYVTGMAFSLFLMRSLPALVGWERHLPRIILA
jgi:NAD(P)-dependent dehydrogenase (short-subunit alcohol dehydrogenase family)